MVAVNHKEGKRMNRSCIHWILIVLPSILPSTAFAQLIVAHRGASHEAPENTLAAFELAWKHGCDGIEGDFYLTADRRIVCIHDKDTKRTTGKNLSVESSTLKELRELDAGAWKGARWAAQSIPTFEEVLGTVPPSGLFVIELKSKSPIVPVLADELKRLNPRGIRMLIISFDADTVRACKQHVPDVPVHWLTSFKRATPLSRYEPTATSVAQTVRDCGADGVGMKGMVEVIDAAFVTSLRQAGCEQYHVWTIDSESDARYFKGLGVYGITTNRPKEIGIVVRQSSTP
jgi:glycerophosphoryl diester phosphodiesterase